MAYEAKTQNDLAKWWVIGTGSVVNRLSEIMDDCPNGPAIYYTTGWTAAGSEYYRTQATANDSAAEKIGAGAWTALVLGAGIGLLNAGEYFYDGATTRIYVRLTGDAVPNATNQVRAHYLWDGSGAGPAIMTELIEDAAYDVHLNMETGDGSTTTTLTSVGGELVYFDTGVTHTLNALATLTLGTLDATNNIGRDGATWSLGYNTSTIVTPFGNNTGNFYAYGSLITYRNSDTLRISAVNWSLVDTHFSFLITGLVSFALSFVKNTSAVATRVIHTWRSTGRYFRVDGTGNPTINNLLTNSIFFAVYPSGDVTITNSTFNTSLQVYVHLGVNVYMIDCTPTTPIAITLNNASAILYAQKTVAIHVADKDGADLSGATVTWLDSQSNTGNTTTDVNGDLTAPFTLTSKQWAGTSETLTDFNPFTFTISKAGYQTLVLENITLSEAVDWHLELQPPSTESLNIIRRFTPMAEPQYVPVPVPMNMAEGGDNAFVDEYRDDMTQREYEQWRMRNSRRR